MTRLPKVVKHTCAALMGDLVFSTHAKSVPLLHGHFNDAISTQNNANKAAIISPLTITLGDEFQGLVRTLADCVPIMQALRLDLLKKGVECRFAMGAVTLETPLNRKRAWNMMGPGLAETRNILNEKRADSLYRFFVPGHPSIQTALDALGASITKIERGWTNQQLADIAHHLSGKSVKEIAELRNVSVHSIYKVRSSAEFDLYALQWQAIFELLTSIDESLD